MPSKTPPTNGRLQFLVCEQVREEANGKHTLLGFFPGEEIKLLAAPPVFIQLALMFIFKDGVGAFDVAFDMEVPGPTQPFPRQQLGSISIIAGKTAVFSLNMQAFPVQSIGEHKVRLQLDREQYARSFTVVR